MRLRGYKDALERSPNIKITRVVDIQGDPRIAFDTSTQIIGKEREGCLGRQNRTFPRQSRRSLSTSLLRAVVFFRNLLYYQSPCDSEFGPWPPSHTRRMRLRSK
jgi:hypothetical protein